MITISIRVRWRISPTVENRDRVHADMEACPQMSWGLWTGNCSSTRTLAIHRKAEKQGVLTRIDRRRRAHSMPHRAVVGGTLRCPYPPPRGTSSPVSTCPRHFTPLPTKSPRVWGESEKRGPSWHSLALRAVCPSFPECPEPSSYVSRLSHAPVQQSPTTGIPGRI